MPEYKIWIWGLLIVIFIISLTISTNKLFNEFLISKSPRQIFFLKIGRVIFILLILIGVVSYFGVFFGNLLAMLLFFSIIALYFTFLIFLDFGKLFNFLIDTVTIKPKEFKELYSLEKNWKSIGKYFFYNYLFKSFLYKIIGFLITSGIVVFVFLKYYYSINPI